MNVLTASPTPSWERFQLGEGPLGDHAQWERERELYCGNELMPDLGVLTRGGLGVQGKKRLVCAAMVEEVCLLF